jgi:hypothetical protein
MRVLIVEDEPYMAEAIGTWLTLGDGMVERWTPAQAPI